MSEYELTRSNILERVRQTFSPFLKPNGFFIDSYQSSKANELIGAMYSSTCMLSKLALKLNTPPIKREEIQLMIISNMIVLRLIPLILEFNTLEKSIKLIDWRDNL